MAGAIITLLYEAKAENVMINYIFLSSVVMLLTCTFDNRMMDVLMMARKVLFPPFQHWNRQ